MDPAIVPAVDPSSEVHHEVLDSPTLEREICDDTTSLVTPSTSTSNTVPILTFDDSTETIKNVLYRPSTSCGIQSNTLMSVTEFTKQLLDGQEKCTSHLSRTKDFFKTLMSPNHPTLSDEELLHAIKSLNTDNDAILDSKKAENSRGLVIQSVLYSIVDKLDLASSESQEQRDVLLSLSSSIHRYNFEVNSQKILLKDIEDILWDYDLPFAASRDLQNAMQSLNRSIELLLSEQKKQKKIFRKNSILLEIMLDPKQDYQIALSSNKNDEKVDFQSIEMQKSIVGKRYG